MSAEVRAALADCIRAFSREGRLFSPADLPAASRAADEPTQITQSPGTQPTASTATLRVPPGLSWTTSSGR